MCSGFGCSSSASTKRASFKSPCNKVTHPSSFARFSRRPGRAPTIATSGISDGNSVGMLRIGAVCRAWGHIVYIDRRIGAGVVAERADGKIALVLRGENPGKGLWGLPAGFMEIDETIEDAARRECLEETGLIVELEDLLGVWS